MSTRSRVALTTAGFLIVLTLSLIILWLVLQGRYLRAEQSARVHVVTELIAEISETALAEGNILRLARVADSTVSERSTSRVMIADRTGAVIVDSDHTAYNVRPGIVARALESDDTIVISRPTHWWGATAVRDDAGRVLGAVMVEFPTDDLLAAQARARMLGLMLGLVGVLIGSMLAFITAQILTKPLEQLLEGIRHLEAGAVAEPVPETGGPELAEIGRAFNQMSDAVLERVSRLELLNQMAAGLPLASDLRDVASTIQRYAHMIMGVGSLMWVADPLSRTLTPVPSEAGLEAGEPVPTGSPEPVARAFADRRTIVVGDQGEYPPGSEIAAGITARSAMVLPLSTYDGVIGTLALTYPRGRLITLEDRALARAIVNSAAPAVMSTLRTEAQARAAATLQSLLVPSEIPEIGPDISAVYVPAEAIAGLGGDYYDIIPVGRSRWSIIVGDTSGKGLDAARNTATAKFVIRSYILEYGDPAETLMWSNRALVLQEQGGRFITLFCSVLDVDAGTLTYANAGHVSPLWYRKASGVIEPQGGQGMALGVAEGVSYVDYTIRMQSGDVFCAFTDGITEARRGREWFGDDRLSELLLQVADRPASEICATILQDVREFTGGPLKDDVVLVALKMP